MKLRLFVSLLFDIKEIVILKHHYDWNILENAAILSTARVQTRIITWLQSEIAHCGKFRHALIQTYLLLATKPNDTRGRVGCPSDTHPLKANSNANLRS